MTDTLIKNLAEILTALAAVIAAVGGILAAYWAYKGKQQSTTNASNIASVQANVTRTMMRLENK
jgi:hypothetical protein